MKSGFIRRTVNSIIAFYIGNVTLIFGGLVLYQLTSLNIVPQSSPYFDVTTTIWSVWSLAFVLFNIAFSPVDPIDLINELSSLIKGKQKGRYL